MAEKRGSPELKAVTLEQENIYKVQWLKAAAMCDYKELQTLLDTNNVDIHCRSPTNYRPDGKQDGKERCALDYAAEGDNVECVKLLLSQGADHIAWIPASQYYVNPLYIAAVMEHWDCLQLLSKTLDINSCNSVFVITTTLNAVAAVGHVSIVRYLVELYDQVDMKTL